MLLLMLALLGHLADLSRGQCPIFCTCIEGETRLFCAGSGVMEVRDFPASIRERVVEIDLSGNRITSIRATDLEGMVHLQILDLSGNQINSIEDGTFSSNTELGTLDLSNNDLTMIPDHLFNSTTLFNLNLCNNILTTLSPFSLVGVQDVVLSNNPIRCDCDLRWFPAFSRSSIRHIEGSCGIPASLNGVSLEQLTQDQLLCNCTPPCVNGMCNMTVGECGCDDGYIGDICNTSCPIGRFGVTCAQNCSCLAGFESSPCDHVDGTCHCLPGYTGPACELKCAENLYGDGCVEVCLCMNEGTCHHVTGVCNCTAGWTGPTCQTGTSTEAGITPGTFNTTEAREVKLPIYALVLLTLSGSLALLVLLIVISAVMSTCVGHNNQRNLRRIEPQYLLPFAEDPVKN